MKCCSYSIWSYGIFDCLRSLFKLRTRTNYTRSSFVLLEVCARTNYFFICSARSQSLLCLVQLSLNEDIFIYIYVYIYIYVHFPFTKTIVLNYAFFLISVRKKTHFHRYLNKDFSKSLSINFYINIKKNHAYIYSIHGSHRTVRRGTVRRRDSSP